MLIECGMRDLLAVFMELINFEPDLDYNLDSG